MKRQRKRIHLVCNAHLDPVWVWRWEDGLTETLSTFRVACDFCEREKDFVFCHNEAVLYRWVEDHDPDLLQRIKRLVKAGRWHIAGGSYLQPDTNLVSGESHIRQFLLGKNYFRKTFGVEPTTAYNFDPFGQPEGYVQILKGCGFDSYTFCRPHPPAWELPTGAFRWRDRSGSEIIARRSDDWYNTNRVGVYPKLKKWLPRYAGERETMILWGIGNHGGGPSRENLDAIKRFAREHPEYELIHSTPEAFFRTVRPRRRTLPTVAGEMQNIFSGCYVSMSRVKRAHRECESLMAATERMAAMAWWLGRADYPTEDLDVAWRDILFGEFHDILPGSGVAPVEKDSLALFGHCSEILRRLKAGTFLRLLGGEKACRAGETPMFVWNPHSFPVRADVELEFNYEDSVSAQGAIELTLRDGDTGRRLAFQRERHEAPFTMDWQMRVAVPLALEPFQMRRVVATWKRRERRRTWRMPKSINRYLALKGKSLNVAINPRTGLIDSAGPAGSKANWVRKGALRPTVWPDRDDAWSCGDPANRETGLKHQLGQYPWGKARGQFRLATRNEAEAIVSPPSLRQGKGRRVGMDPIRVVEYGLVRTIIEAIFVMDASVIVRRYVLPKTQPWFEVRDRIFWNERDSMLKIAVPLAFKAANTLAETPYGAVTRPIPKFHVDEANQRWAAATEGKGRSGSGGKFLAVLNDGCHAYSIARNTLYVSVLRSPAYSSFGLDPGDDASQFRAWPRQDQGEHEVRYRFMFGEGFAEAQISREAQAMNVPPQWIIHYPPKPVGKPRPARSGAPFISISARNVQVAAVKKQERGKSLVVRLWEQKGRETPVTLKVRGATGSVKTLIGPYALKTLVLRRRGKRLVARETNLIEG